MDEDGLGGVTSNPAIFEKAIDGSDDYTHRDRGDLEGRAGLAAKAVYERLAVKDIQDAADVLRPVYDRTKAHDGYVSLEVAPDLANDTDGHPRRGAPALEDGEPAQRDDQGAGHARGRARHPRADHRRHQRQRHAALRARGLRGAWPTPSSTASRRARRKGQPLDHVASVASFFVSRIDSAVDALLDGEAEDGGRAPTRRGSRRLLGKVAIANAKLAYQSYKKIFSGPRWEALAAKGAQTQRVLWASTGTKNPRYRDVLYIEELIGPDTVNTVPPETLAAFRDHGKLRPSLEEDVDGRHATCSTTSRRRASR